ncbi:hypothetical protein I6B53_10455 [Schaalia sp. 19OD2882]|uniref:TY-Chap domain-containing protein n=1 Tax=Schaalia sp. 19OD2882 TaxID=2794089 RepID=UPI001C1F11B5|nr:hypothetical protein [Schaalia sp. 19OD2882]QWW19484.1 hypothetical protein I6B53_10455 [Schaalia sp. 19OD2882]
MSLDLPATIRSVLMDWATFEERLTDVLAHRLDAAVLLLGTQDSDKGFVQVAGRFTSEPHPQLLSAEIVTSPVGAPDAVVTEADAQMFTDAGFKYDEDCGSWDCGVTHPWTDDSFRRIAACWVHAMRDLFGHSSPDDVTYYGWRYPMRIRTPYGDRISSKLKDYEIASLGLRYFRPEEAR